MGVLEDAIREHLELRRRHGAAEDELRHHETEALGPARREAEPTRLVEVSPPDESEPGMPFDGAAEGDTSYEPGDRPRPEPALEDEPFVSDEPIVADDDPNPAAEPLAEEPRPREAALDDTAIEDPLPAEPPPHEESLPEDPLPKESLPEDPLPREEPLPEEQPVTEVGSPFDEPFGDEPEPLDEEAAPAASEDEDVLEETPDFLSETPEHDRLWFEQKPPRDFDFD